MERETSKKARDGKKSAEKEKTADFKVLKLEKVSQP